MENPKLRESSRRPLSGEISHRSLHRGRFFDANAFCREDSGY